MITVIAGTNRTENNSVKVAHHCAGVLSGLGSESQVFSLEQLPPDFAFSAAFGGNSAAFDALVEKYIVPVHKIVIVAAEYNGSYPGVLKTFIDCVSPSIWNGKRAALVGISSGRSGNVRGLEHLTGVLHYLKVEVLSAKPVLSGIEGLIDSSGDINEEEAQKVLKEQANAFLGF